MGAGTYTATILISDTVDNVSTATISVTLVITSPLSASSVNKTLTYFLPAGPNPAAATTAITVTGTDSVLDTYTTVVAGACPSYMTVVSANTNQAKAASPDTLTFSISTATAANLGAAITTCNVQLQYNAVTFATVTFTSVSVVAQLIPSATSIALTYLSGGGGTNSGTTNITVPALSPTTPFFLDVATVPGWLTVTPATGSATTSNTVITFALKTAVTAGMAPGNYTANLGRGIGFYQAGFADLLVPVTLSISGAVPTVGLKEGTTQIANVWSFGTIQPAPTVTPFSNNQPVSFSATCAVVVTSSTTYTPSATSCLLNGAQALLGSSAVTGVAYTFGDVLTVTLDSAIFAFPIGTTATVTVIVVPQAGPSLTLAYKYTFQPIDPTLSSLFPTSVAQIPLNTSTVILVNGANFVGPQNIANASVLPTQVYLNGSSTPVAQSTVEVVSPTQLMVTIPQTLFPAYSGTKTSTTMAIGVANQTGSQTTYPAKVSTNLTITNAPVIYSLASTASYTNNGLGVNPGIAAYDLVSIFGDNFGYKSLVPNFSTSTLSAFNQVPAALVISGTGKTAVNLLVNFKDGTKSFAAPILFANQNQINAIVPAGMTIGHNVSVTVTSGATSNVSDGNFQATVVAADPGVFTLSSAGTGQGAILNHDGSVNQSGNAEHIGQYVSIYMTGLGAPDSIAPDVAIAAPANTVLFSASCSAVSLPGSATTPPGYMQVVNTKATNYVPPTLANIDGLVIESTFLKANILPPCLTDLITVTFDPAGSPTTATTGVAGVGVVWAGFSSGSVAGLYQINVFIPALTTTGNTVGMTVTMGTYTSPVVTMAIQP